jgi:aminopeptidase N
MKKIFTLLLSLSAFSNYAQDHECAKVKQNSYGKHFDMLRRSAPPALQIAHEMKYDVKFVHLSLNLERTNKYISGNVRTVATVVAPALDTFMCLLHQNHTVDSIRFNGALLSYFRQDSMIKAGLPASLPNGATFTAQVYYKGTAPTGGSAIGSGFDNGTSGSWGNQATWSLSESFVAYHWWPCKQALTDKIDSSWVFVTTDSTNKVGSNGILKNVVITGNKKRYEWKSHKPIDYYLISVAVAKYKEYNLYAKPQYLTNDSILIQNYIYDGAINNPAWTSNQKITLNKMPLVMKFLCNMYGMYPFYKEKYGHCMAPIGGGMEHQTMTTLGYFDYYVDAHELGHQWWGDNVTCKSWGDIWMNEGFASYTEHLVAQYLDASNFAVNLNAAHNSVMTQPGGSVFFTNADTMNSARIFSSRLTYDKGGAIIHSLRFITNNDSVWFNTLRGFQNTYKNSTASAIDFQNYYQAQTNISPTVFFNQWYYGQGYPTFTVKYNYKGGNFFLKNTESVSMPSVTPMFVTPLEYRIVRAGKPDTTIRLQQNVAVENYTLPLTGTVTAVICDPNNWIINKSTVSRDTMLGYVAPPPPPPPVDPNPVALNELAASYEAITIGPNPAKDILVIGNSLRARATIQLFDLQGKLLKEKPLAEETQLNLENFAEGVYIVKVLDAQGAERYSQKIVKR